MADVEKTLGWGNQDPVVVTPEGAVLPPLEARADGASDLVLAGTGLYRLARIINDQYANPFREGKVTQKVMTRVLRWVEAALDAAPMDPSVNERQRYQLRASAGLVLLSLAESQEKRTSKAAMSLVSGCMQRYFRLLDEEQDPILAERLSLNLDWVLPALPKPLAQRAEEVMEAGVPQWPPYDSWFAAGNTTLNIDWKCGSEFLEGWVKRLKKEGFVVEREGGSWTDTVLTRTFEYQDQITAVRMVLGPERGDVFRRMDDPDTHVVGYDGHSDWGRKIPESLEHAAPQQGEKALLYLLCCGKQMLQSVRDVYPRAHVVTTFNSARFTADFTYSEDFSAFMHILKGFARRESWEEIRNRVNKDWSNNPDKNYIFPIEALAMARSLDRDHDGQSDVLDLLLDYDTFSPVKDTRAEFVPRKPERGPHDLVGTVLHLGVQVFHTLAHFNQQLEFFSRDLRVFSGGWFDPEAGLLKGELQLGPTRVRLARGEGGTQYTLRMSHHHAHASEEALRALICFSLGICVMGQEPRVASLPPEDAVLTALTLVAHGLEVDDAPGRDEAVWRGVLEIMGLPVELDRYAFVAAKRQDHHWYAGGKAALKTLHEGLDASLLSGLATWMERLD